MQYYNISINRYSKKNNFINNRIAIHVIILFILINSIIISIVIIIFESIIIHILDM